MSMKNYNYTIGNRTRDLPACSAVPHSIAPPRAPLMFIASLNKLTLANNIGDEGWGGEGVENRPCVFGTSTYEGVKLRNRQKIGLSHFFCLYITPNIVLFHISILYLSHLKLSSKK
jgi:hypothetical protein